MQELDKVCMALFDLAQNQETFGRLVKCQEETAKVQEETDKLKDASDALEREIVNLDKERAALSKLIDAAFPPEARSAAENIFFDKFNDYQKRLHSSVEDHVSEARALELKTVVALAKAQALEMEEIKALKANL